jgi:hypothetical protein
MWLSHQRSRSGSEDHAAAARTVPRRVTGDLSGALLRVAGPIGEGCWIWTQEWG